jgi:hypothetical protein
MKLRLLFLLSILCFLPALGYAQSAGGVKSINGVPGPFTFGTGATCTGTTCTFSGGGGGSPAGVNGSPQINASGSLGAQANVFYQQSGDTIASIETACSSLCTYVVSSPQTITLAASHAMNSNVFIDFTANGKWTVNGAFTLSNIQADATSELTQHFAGTSTIALSTYNTLVPVEWFGAVGDWNGTTGTNNLTAIQNTINATTYGQILYQPLLYAIGGTLTISKVAVGMKGPRASRGDYFGLVETVAGDDAVDVTAGRGYFEDFSIESSVAQTGTATGFHLNGGEALLVKNVLSQDFFYDFYIHNGPSGTHGWYNNNAIFTAISAGLTAPVGFYLDSADGTAENSLTLRDDAMTTTPTGGPLSAIGLEANGAAVNDFDVFNFNVAGGNGILVNYTGSGTTIGCSDVHLNMPTIDNYYQYAIKVNNCTAASTGSVEISGGWAVSGGSTSVSGGKVIDIEASTNISVNHMEIGAHSGGSPSQYGIYANGSSAITATGNTFFNQSNAITFNNTTGSAATGNSISGNANIDIAIQGGSTYNSITGNVMSGLGGAGLYIPIGNNNNTYVGNSCNSAASPCVSDSGTGNGLVGTTVVNGVLSVTNSAGAGAGANKADLAYITSSNAFLVDGFGANTTTEPDFYAISRNSTESLNDTLIHCVYNAGCTFSHAVNALTYQTATNCSSAAAPAVCGSAAAGSVVVAAAGTTVVVDTTAVTANSQILVQEDSSLGTKLSVTCNTVAATAPPTISARTAATSFTITTTIPTTNPRCFSYTIVN